MVKLNKEHKKHVIRLTGLPVLPAVSMVLISKREVALVPLFGEGGSHPLRSQLHRPFSVTCYYWGQWGYCTRF